MGPCGKIGGKVQEPRHHIAVEEPTREHQRRLGQNEEKAGDEEERQVLQVIQLDSPDTLDSLVGLETFRIGRAVEGCPLDVLRRAKATLHLLAAGRRVCEATENLAVFGRAARFLDSRQTAQLRRGADYNEFHAVLDGLAVLVACYGRGAGRRGRMETHRAASLAASTGRGAARIVSLTVIGKKSYK
jgi:hypothetical protein